MDLYIFIHSWFAMGIKFVFTDCGSISPQRKNVTEGEKVQLQFLPKYEDQNAEIWYFYGTNSTHNEAICWRSNSSCISEEYRLHNYFLYIENFTKRTAGQYTINCGINLWSIPAALNSQPADKSTSNKHQDISKGSTNEYPSTTLMIATVENEMAETEVVADTSGSKQQHVQLKNSSMTYSVSATVESKTVKTYVNAQTNVNNERELHQKTISTESTKEHHSVTNIATRVESKTAKTEDSADQPRNPQPSERETSAIQHEAEHNPGALYDQQASSSAAEQINSEYATVVPKKDRISSTQQRETNKVVVKEEESTPEYAVVVKNRQPDGSVERSTQRGKDKNEHGLLYADLDLVSRPQREAHSKEDEATEYVSIDFQKTATLKSQRK